jgi:hypothetical protein
MNLNIHMKCHPMISCFIHSSHSLSYESSIACSKRVLHRVRSSASPFNIQFPPVSIRSLSSCLCLLPHLPVTYILLSLFSSITCFRRQFLCKMWPIRLAFLFTVCRIFLFSLTLLFCTKIKLYQYLLIKILSNRIDQTPSKVKAVIIQWMTYGLL